MEFAAWIGAIGTVVTVVLAMVAIRTQHPRKRITYQVRSRIALLADRPSWIGTTEYLIDGRRVEAPEVLTVAIRNEGASPIEAKDFASRLTIRCIGAAILQARVDTVPADIPVEATIEGDGLHLRPLLMNARDEIVAALLVAGQATEVRVLGRVSGVKQIEQRRVGEPSQRSILGPALIASAVSLLATTAVVAYSLATNAVRQEVQSLTDQNALLARQLGSLGEDNDPRLGGEKIAEQILELAVGQTRSAYGGALEVRLDELEGSRVTATVRTPGREDVAVERLEVRGEAIYISGFEPLYYGVWLERTSTSSATFVTTENAD